MRKTRFLIENTAFSPWSDRWRTNKVNQLDLLSGHCCDREVDEMAHVHWHITEYIEKKGWRRRKSQLYQWWL